jgi:hypothetical protein
VRGLYIHTLLGLAVLADFEFAFYAGNWDAKALNSSQHGAAEAVGHGVPLLGKGGFVGLNEAGEQSFFPGTESSSTYKVGDT